MGFKTKQQKFNEENDEFKDLPVLPSGQWPQAPEVFPLKPTKLGLKEEINIKLHEVFVAPVVHVFAPEPIIEKHKDELGVTHTTVRSARTGKVIGASTIDATNSVAGLKLARGIKPNLEDCFISPYQEFMHGRKK